LVQQRTGSTPASGSSPPTTATPETDPRSTPPAKPSSTPPTKPTQNASRTGHPDHPANPPASGSTRPHYTPADNHPKTHKEIGKTLLTPSDTNVSQIRRYEAGTSAPTLDVLHNLALSSTRPTPPWRRPSPLHGPTDEDAPGSLNILGALIAENRVPNAFPGRELKALVPTRQMSR